MTTAIITFEEIEARTENTVAFAIFAKRIRDHVQAFTIGALFLPFFANRLTGLSRALKSGVLDNCSDEQLRELAELLKQLNSQVLKLNAEANASGISSVSTVSGALHRISESSEDFKDILEGIYLTLDPSFNKVMSNAVDRLNLGVKESASVSR
jgi:hypothetical protein